MKNNILYYSVGPLLYCPANKISIVDTLTKEKFGNNFSLAFCLEDTINDKHIEIAENILVNNINSIYNNYKTNSFYLPKIFIRVRNSQQIIKLTKAFGNSINIITGYIIPKFSTENADSYIKAIIKVNEISKKRLYVMPIYENSSIIDLRSRYNILYELKDKLYKIEELVLNIRVGGNDLCNMFGLRRHFDESIHKIRPISDIFSDIIAVYGMDYVVSGPVYEYYSGPNWKQGLIQEIKDDKLCGFIGKTIIHPNQINIVNDTFKVSQSDYNDAQSILNWNKDSNNLVAGNLSNERMNEYKTHINWASKVLFLADVYGIK